MNPRRMAVAGGVVAIAVSGVHLMLALLAILGMSLRGAAGEQTVLVGALVFLAASIVARALRGLSAA